MAKATTKAAAKPAKAAAKPAPAAAKPATTAGKPAKAAAKPAAKRAIPPKTTTVPAKAKTAAKPRTPKPAKVEKKGIIKQTSDAISQLASDILHDRIEPTIEQIKSLAASALGQDETKGKRAKTTKKK